VFPADIWQGAGVGEAAAFVQADTGHGGRIADDRDDQAQVECLATLQQRRQELTADACALAVGRDVDRVLDRELVGRACAVGIGIGVASDCARLLGDQIGEALAEHVGAAASHFGQVRRVVLEAGYAGAHGMAVDRGDGGQVGVAAVADDQGHA
jgi:hypothetical protein